jgi:hypothetical protein
MAFNASAFRKAALNAGYSQSQVDDFIAKKQTEALVTSGNIPFTPEFAQSNPGIATELVSGGLKTQSTKKAFSDTEIEKLNNTRDTLDRVNRIIAVLQKNGDKFPQGYKGKIAEKLVSSGLAGSMPTLANAFGLDSETQQAIGDMMLIRGQGDRMLIGGRMTGYLLDRLGIGFPGVEKNSETNLRHLNQLKKTLLSDLSSFASNSGFKSINQIPGMEDIQDWTVVQ